MNNKPDFEKLALVIDRLDNISHSLSLPLPADLHLKAIKEAIPKIVKELKENYTELSGENPWE